jgi:hypothetical protein
MNTDKYFHTVFTEKVKQIQRNENYGHSFLKFTNISNQTFTTKEKDSDSLHI